VKFSNLLIILTALVLNAGVANAANKTKKDIVTSVKVCTDVNKVLLGYNHKNIKVNNYIKSRINELDEIIGSILPDYPDGSVFIDNVTLTTKVTQALDFISKTGDDDYTRSVAAHLKQCENNIKDLITMLKENKTTKVEQQVKPEAKKQKTLSINKEFLDRENKAIHMTDISTENREVLYDYAQDMSKCKMYALEFYNNQIKKGYEDGSVSEDESIIFKNKIYQYAMIPFRITEFYTGKAKTQVQNIIRMSEQVVTNNAPTPDIAQKMYRCTAMYDEFKEKYKVN
jgi:hypothetical protein